MQLVFVEILAVLAMAYGDVSHIVPNANDINGLSGYQYEPTDDSLQYLPPSLHQQPQPFEQVPLELPNGAAESFAAPAVEDQSSISPAFVRSSIETSEAESSNDSQQTAVTPSPYLPPSLSQQPQASEELALELPVAAQSVSAEANLVQQSSAVDSRSNVIEANDVSVQGIDEPIPAAGSVQVSQQPSSLYLPPLLSSLLSSHAETNVVQQEVSPLFTTLPAAGETAAPQLPQADTSENSSGDSALSAFAFECNQSGGNQLCQSAGAVQQESRVSIVDAASAEAQVAVPVSKYLPAQADIAETQPADTQVFEIQSNPSSFAPELPLVQTNVEINSSRQYLTPLSPSSRTEQAEHSVAVETEVVQPSHTFSENEGYNYQKPANSFEF